MFNHGSRPDEVDVDQSYTYYVKDRDNAEATQKKKSPNGFKNSFDIPVDPLFITLLNDITIAFNHKYIYRHN